MCVCLKETHLYMSTKGSVVQGSASRPVRHVDVAKQRDQSLSTAHCLVASCNVERRLPVLVPGINICTVLQQHRHCILDGEREWVSVCRQRVYFLIRLGVLTKYASVCAGGCVWAVLKVFAILRGAHADNSTEKER